MTEQHKHPPYPPYEQPVPGLSGSNDSDHIWRDHGFHGALPIESLKLAKFHAALHVTERSND